MAATVTALLGPTNTGKTHRAVERMLEHESGMIGLPLRLLAREVYDRITRRIGEDAVALVTGEEKRIGNRARYYVCTTEAMPTDRGVDFVAIDEIQLCAHPERGHVFTERLLALRGRLETMFMGADTMRSMLAALVPDARVERHPRLSALVHAGSHTLASLPPRSAVVAFSMAHVYELAERIRRKRGGASVVLGALSPRARNAQVAQYQAGEVDYLVATDAIGMGLNLEVSHVAFADLHKFDGKEVRPLDTAELAQIAGRAGRHLSNGSFGTLAPMTPLPPPVASALEKHRFPEVRQLFWRNADLDMSSVDALIASLEHRPERAQLRVAGRADDHAALAVLAARPGVRELAQGPEAVALLWDVCRIPDFRKLTLDYHVGLLAELFEQLAARRRIDPEFMRRRIERIDDVEGDIETLLARMAFIRTWTYIAWHPRWVDGAAAWQEHTREIEDRLSDALHARLVERFVERRARMAIPARVAAANKSSPFAALAALRDAMLGEDGRSGAESSWVDTLVDAPFEHFDVEPGGRIMSGDRVVGRMTRGPDLLRPEVALALDQTVGAGERSRIQRRLVAWTRDLVAHTLAPLRRHDAALSPSGRGLVYQLEHALGTVRAKDASAQLAALTAGDRDALARIGVELGRRVVYLPALLEPAAVRRRAALCSAFAGHAEPVVPGADTRSLPRQRHVLAATYLALGFPVFGPRAVRADVVERVGTRLHRAARRGPFKPPGDLAGQLGCEDGDVARVVEAFGFRRVSGGRFARRGRPRRRVL